MHPNLKGQAALADVILSRLKDRAAFGWPTSAPDLCLEPACIAKAFRLDPAVWAVVCSRTATHYGQLAFLTTDSAERLTWRNRYRQAAGKIKAGIAPEDTDVPGVGTRE